MMEKDFESALGRPKTLA